MSKHWSQLNILIACEYSGRVRDAFRKEGFNATSCDILDTDVPGPHIKGDILKELDNNWDVLIGFPPCTFITNSGVRWLYSVDENNEKIVNIKRMKSMRDGCKFFNDLLYSKIKHICIENPIQHKYARNHIRKYDQIIHPWQHGHSETKQTCLWLVNLPKIQPTHIVPKGGSKIHKMPPSKNRGKLRSLTYSGIANAMAKQFGDFLKEQYP